MFENLRVWANGSAARPLLQDNLKKVWACTFPFQERWEPSVYLWIGCGRRIWRVPSQAEPRNNFCSRLQRKKKRNGAKFPTLWESEDYGRFLGSFFSPAFKTALWYFEILFEMFTVPYTLASLSVFFPGSPSRLLLGDRPACRRLQRLPRLVSVACFEIPAFLCVQCHRSHVPWSWGVTRQNYCLPLTLSIT